MDVGRFEGWTRRRFGLGITGLTAGLLGAAGGGEARAGKKKKQKGRSNPCAGKNYCLDSSHTCAGGTKRCLVKAFGGNVCGGFFYVDSCSTCSSSCPDCECAMAVGCSSSGFLCAQP